MGVMLRELEIPKSIWRYYTSENADFCLKMKLDLWKSLKFSNRSGACIVAKTVIFRSVSGVVGVALQKQSAGQPGGCAGTGGGVRGDKPPQGTDGDAITALTPCIR